MHVINDFVKSEIERLQAELKKYAGSLNEIDATFKRLRAESLSQEANVNAISGAIQAYNNILSTFGEDKVAA